MKFIIGKKIIYPPKIHMSPCFQGGHFKREISSTSSGPALFQEIGVIPSNRWDSHLRIPWVSQLTKEVSAEPLVTPSESKTAIESAGSCGLILSMAVSGSHKRW